MGDANHGSLKEQNSIWEYDENSKFEATGFTHLGYPEVLDSAHQVVNSQGPYHLRSNNCEIFCEKLSKVISVESWYEYFQGVKRRSQIRWNDPPEPQPDVYSGFGQEPEVIPADLLNHSDIGMRKINVVFIAAAFLMVDQGHMPTGIMMFGTLISTWIFYR
ncbi:hypothetical protein COCHEDRAFT_1019625 [Bipolaris maydis C5]|uniref:Uncharacterized protein n=2 Tax=Cochliobolus heterostrophus TaxID=5016 RepID=M2URS5_COCH5|nr:hypothetical protein COCHEDRAFT_1019625 [Bipolaris maydis C5]KAJ6212973.1 hypothetical protein PSV09DRAFT_1019625 [Bipolaris maydis]